MFSRQLVEFGVGVLRPHPAQRLHVFVYLGFIILHEGKGRYVVWEALGLRVMLLLKEVGAHRSSPTRRRRGAALISCILRIICGLLLKMPEASGTCPGVHPKAVIGMFFSMQMRSARLLARPMQEVQMLLARPSADFG